MGTFGFDLGSGSGLSDDLSTVAAPTAAGRVHLLPDPRTRHPTRPYPTDSKRNPSVDFPGQRAEHYRDHKTQVQLPLAARERSPLHYQPVSGTPHMWLPVGDRSCLTAVARKTPELADGLHIELP